MNNLDRLPRRITSAVSYQLTIEGWEDRWTLSYKRGLEVLGYAVAYGETIEEAADRMIYLFNNNTVLYPLRHLIKTDE